jgi:carbamoyltransferase
MTTSHASMPARDRGRPWVLGISASHNGAACLLRGSEIVVAVQEERLSRRKRQRIHGAEPALAITYCLDYAGIGARDLSMVVLCPQGAADHPNHDLRANPLLQIDRFRTPTLTVPHHLAHAVSTFATSGFPEAAILVIDGLGSSIQDLPASERAVIVDPVCAGAESISLYAGIDALTQPLEKHVAEGGRWLSADGGGMPQFHSLGAMYSAVARQIFGDVLEAGKVMGLAPYGRPSLPPEDFFQIQFGRFAFSSKVPALFRGNERWPARDEEYRDLASSVQVALEQAVLHLVHRLHELCPSQQLCYAGGVALNSVANERIIRESKFRRVHIMPAAEDSGCAVGAAYLGLWALTQKNDCRPLTHDAVGRPYTRSEVLASISQTPAVEIVPTSNILADTAELLSSGAIIGWFQGRSELGPRALGQRSILCDPRPPNAKSTLNLRVKRREAFRPFAPAVLLEHAADWFDFDGFSQESPHMLRVCPFKLTRRQSVPAVVHVDGTGRLQTVSRENNPGFYELIAAFAERTAVPMLLNTSFNVMGMPIVESPHDALQCLLSADLDYCVLEGILVKRSSRILIDPSIAPDYLASDQEIPTQSASPIRDESRGASNGPWEDFIGVYANAVGSLDIHCCGTALLATWYAQSTQLTAVGPDVFLAAAEAFAGLEVRFLRNTHGQVTGIRVIREADLGALEFSRRIEAIAPSRVELDSYGGDYEVKGQRVSVTAHAQHLALSTPDGPFYVLDPVQGGCFALRNTPGYSVEFVANAERLCPRMLVYQPNGVFVLSRIAQSASLEDPGPADNP